MVVAREMDLAAKELGSASMVAMMRRLMLWIGDLFWWW